MKQSQLFTKTLKEISAEAVSQNHQFLIKAGFVDQVMAGAYTFLPLGCRVIRKIEDIVRQEMDAVGGQEILMPALQPKHLWEKTGRWEEFDVLFKVKSENSGMEYVFAPTHEEVVVPMAKKYIQSYKDLPFAVYQIQTKFRDEKRAKSGLLRGREFIMKDLYSFHASPEDLAVFYEKMASAYKNVFRRVGLRALITSASGGTFSKKSHEFQVETELGEDIIYMCKGNKEAVNEEVATDEDRAKGEKLSACEVGNIFKLNTKFSEPFELTYQDADGQEKIVYMGCYGIGISRLLGVVAEVCNDKDGLIWPMSIAPYRVHLLAVNQENKEVFERAQEFYLKLKDNGVEVLFDDRDKAVGEKFKDSDLIGIPYRVIVSKKTGDKAEVKRRGEKDAKVVSFDELLPLIA